MLWRKIKQGRKIDDEEALTLNRVVRVDLTEKVAFENFKGEKGACYEDIWGKGIPDKRISQCKGSEAELDLHIQKDSMQVEQSEQIAREGERSDRCGQGGPTLYGSVDLCRPLGLFLEWDGGRDKLWFMF